MFYDRSILQQFTIVLLNSLRVIGFKRKNYMMIIEFNVYQLIRPSKLDTKANSNTHFSISQYISEHIIKINATSQKKGYAMLYVLHI